MAHPLVNRTWLSPVVGTAFVAVAVSGTLMLFHVKLPACKMLHEWMGVVMTVAGAIHLLLNWKVLWGYFEKRSARMALGVTVVLCAGLAIVGALTGTKHRERPPVAQDTNR